MKKLTLTVALTILLLCDFITDTKMTDKQCLYLLFLLTPINLYKTFFDYSFNNPTVASFHHRQLDDWLIVSIPTFLLTPPNLYKTYSDCSFNNITVERFQQIVPVPTFLLTPPNAYKTYFGCSFNKSTNIWFHHRDDWQIVFIPTFSVESSKSL